MDFFGLHYRVCGYAVNAETGFITPDLTFLYISFTNLFCQNLVKKNRKLMLIFPFENADIWCDKRY